MRLSNSTEQAEQPNLLRSAEHSDHWISLTRGLLDGLLLWEGLRRTNCEGGIVRISGDVPLPLGGKSNESSPPFPLFGGYNAQSVFIHDLYAARSRHDSNSEKDVEKDKIAGQKRAKMLILSVKVDRFLR